MDDRNEPVEQGIEQLSERIIELINVHQFDRAEDMLQRAKGKAGSRDRHRLIALDAVLQREKGNLAESISLMRRALLEMPNWLSHLSRLADYLMDAKRWLEANDTLDEVIFLSERTKSSYFLQDARFRKMFCLKELGRHNEAAQQKVHIAPGAAAFIGTKRYRVEDLA
jgi:tetratricopeptide (TPR) repeat protein